MKDQKGMAMIAVAGMSAIVVALALSLLLAASTLFETANKSQNEEQCQILASALSGQIQSNLEQTDALDDSISAWLEDQLMSASWPMNDLGRAQKDTPESWQKLETQGAGGSTIRLVIFWDSDTPEQIDTIEVTIRVTAVLGDASATVSSRFVPVVEYEEPDSEGEEPLPGLETISKITNWILSWRE